MTMPGIPREAVPSAVLAEFLEVVEPFSLTLSFYLDELGKSSEHVSCP